MKKFFSLILILLLAVSLLGCETGDMKRPAEDSGRSDTGSPEPCIIKIGTVSFTNLEHAVNLFNAENDFGIKVEIADYRGDSAEGDIKDQAVTRLNMELATGEGPDIIDFETIPGRSNYLKQGFLMDMSDYFNRDLQLDDYYMLKELNQDGMYYFPRSFGIMCLYGAESVFGDKAGWTLEEYANLMSSPQYSKTYETGESFLERMIIYGVLPRFVDYENSTCRFDSEQFKELLGYAKDLNSRAHDDSDYGSISSGNILYSDILVENPLDIRESEMEEGVKLSYFGYPTADGKNGSFAYLTCIIGVNANTKHPAAVWEFIKFLINNDEVQFDASYSSIPIKKSVLEQQIASFQNPYSRYEGKEITVNDDGTFNVDGVRQDCQYNPEPAMTDRQLNKFYKLLNEAKTPYEFDNKIYDIITECAAGYFGNNRSLEQTVSDIQSRVSIYLSEQK